MSDYLEKWPAIDEMLIERLEEMYALTDSHLQADEWDRAYLAGQRDVVNKIKGIYQQQHKRAAKAQHKRQ